MTITIELPAGIAQAISVQASRSGQNIAHYIEHLAEQDVTSAVESPQKRNTRLIALLDQFEQGDVQEQEREYAALKAGLEAARPGQRRLFGEGFNS